jgi:hypothetical protein
MVYINLNCIVHSFVVKRGYIPENELSFLQYMFVYPSIDGRIILRCIFRQWDGGYGLD